MTTTFTVVNNNSFLSSLGGGGVFLGGERGRLLMRSRSRGKHYSMRMMDNENKMKMKTTKTTTMMENTNENEQKRKVRRERSERKRKPSVTCKATTNAFQNNHVFSAAQATGGGTTKLWSGNPNDVSLLAILRCIAFTLWTFSLAVPLFLTMCVIFPFCYFLDRTRRYALSFVNDVWAICSTSPFVKITVEGREHLPKQDEPAVYVANHASFMDIFSLFHLKRPFKFISKTSNFIIPIIGWSMFLTGHVPLKRTDRRSQMETLKICRETLQKNGSVLFFPEGTRSKDGTMAEFKKGAFSVAAKEKVPIVPITIVNAGGIMRNGKEWMLRKGEIKVIVHPRIEASENADELCQKSENVIKEALVNNS
jgi:1-acyl-sn-glycerol-3-phosphate acyltransferase